MYKKLKRDFVVLFVSQSPNEVPASEDLQKTGEFGSEGRKIYICRMQCLSFRIIYFRLLYNVFSFAVDCVYSILCLQLYIAYDSSFTVSLITPHCKDSLSFVSSSTS